MKKVFLKKFFAILSLTICLTMIVTGFPARAVNGSEQSVEFEIDCKSAILIEASTGSVLYQKDPDLTLPPASVTKVMTLLLVMEAIEDGKLKYKLTENKAHDHRHGRHNDTVNDIHPIKRRDEFYAAGNPCAD
jgi:D-alanyl-D-alanine carboxypeptidase